MPELPSISLLFSSTLLLRCVAIIIIVTFRFLIGFFSAEFFNYIRLVLIAHVLVYLMEMDLGFYGYLCEINLGFLFKSVLHLMGSFKLVWGNSFLFDSH